MQDHLVELGVVQRAVQLACRAPSLHNSQPWRWVVDREGLHLHLARGRILPAADRSGREAIISCGAVLDHLRVAMAAAGWESHTERFPDPGDPDHLASVRFRRRDDDPVTDDSVTEVLRRRADAILLRRTDRLPLAAPRDPAGFRQLAAGALADIADTSDIADTAAAVQLDVIAEEDRPRLAEASQLTESRRADDSSYHIELGWWTAGYDLSEGIPPGSLAADTDRERVDVGRAFPVGHGERHFQQDRDHSMIVALSTAEDTPQAALGCGEALSAVLLEATLIGLGSCPLTHITEVPDSRQIVAELIDRTAVPQVLIRIGRVPPLRESPAPTPRRSLEDVLEVRA
ncbi:Acg family FMN-binding oxidoreductase [Mycolicibacterium thermoresistibile]